MRVRNENGGSLVEFAIIMPFLLVILFGIIDFSILLYDKVMLTNASREGAREGILFDDPRPLDARIRARIDYYLDNGNNLISFPRATPRYNVLISPAEPRPVVPARDAIGDRLTVTVTSQYHWLVISYLVGVVVPGANFPDPIPLRAVTVMRLE